MDRNAITIPNLPKPSPEKIEPKKNDLEVSIPKIEKIYDTTYRIINK